MEYFANKVQDARQHKHKTAVNTKANSFFITYLQNQKSAATEATALKTQTPIVAKLTLREKGCNRNYINGTCIFNKFSNVIVAEKSIIIPIKR